MKRCSKLCVSPRLKMAVSYYKNIENDVTKPSITQASFQRRTAISTGLISNTFRVGK